MADGKQTAAQAFDAFAQKFQRFIAAGGDAPDVKKASTEQDTINGAMNAKRRAVIERYKSFLTPDAAIDADQNELKAAYALFKAVQAANAEHATDETRLDGIPLLSPLVHADRYTIGGDFVYLQAWFCYEQHISDYVPELQPQPTGENSYKLVFVPARHHHVTYDDKEKLDAIRSCFYSGA